MLDLGTSFVASVARDPTAVAIVDGDLRLTYAQWYARISSVVALFDELGLKPGDNVVTALQNRWEAATLHWACQLAGITITPVNWRAKSDEIDYCLQDSGAKAVVFEAVSAEEVEQSDEARPRIRISLDGDTVGTIPFRLLAAQLPSAVQSRANPDSWSVMLYTSGTTARPKGVPRRHRAEAKRHRNQDRHRSRRA